MTEEEIVSKLREWQFAPDHLEVFDHFLSRRGGDDSS